MAIMKRVFFLLAFAVAIASSAQISSSSWAATINMAGRQRMLSQKMSKEFLLVTKGMDPVENEAALLSTMDLFDTSLQKLMNGDAASNIPKPPTADIANQLDVVQGLWTTYKGVLSNNLGSSDPVILQKISDQSVPLLKQMNAGVGLYQTAAGMAAPGAVVNVAGRQRMLSQKMSKEALLVGLDVDKEANLGSLEGSRALFINSHNALVNGNNVGTDAIPFLAKTTDACVRNQLETVVAGVWAAMGPAVQDIIDTKFASAASLKVIYENNLPLLVKSNEAVTMYVSLGETGIACTLDGKVPGNGCTDEADPLCVLSTLRVAEYQVEYIQKMSREYLEIANGFEIETNRENLLVDIKTYDDNVKVLLQGSMSKNILPVPHSHNILLEMQKLSAHWGDFKVLMETTLLTVNKDSKELLTEVEHLEHMLEVETDGFYKKWEAYARYKNVPLPDSKQTYARFQRVYIQRLVKEAMFERLGIQIAYYQAAQRSTAALFDKTMKTIIEGSAINSLPMMEEICPLAKLYDVKTIWLDMDLSLVQFRRNEPPTIDGVVGFTVNRDLIRLENALKELTQIFVAGTTSCGLAEKLTDQQWYNQIVMVFRTRKYAERAMRDYFELAAGVGDPEANKEHLRADVAEATKDLYLCLVGDERNDLPTAPTQAINVALHHANELWQLMEVALLFNVDTGDYSESALEAIGQLNQGFLTDMTKVGHYLVDECHDVAPHLPSAVWELAERQLELVQEMANEALLVKMNINVEQNRAAYMHLADLFENSHWKLLLGPGDPRDRRGYVQSDSRRRSAGGHRRLAAAGGDDPLLLDTGVPQTTAPCTLRTMETVLSRFDTFHGFMRQVIGNDTAVAEAAVLSLEPSIYAVSAALDEASKAYHETQTCTAVALSDSAWEKSLYSIGNAPYYYQQALTEFSLMTIKTGDDNTGRDYSTTWRDLSSATLVEHEQFCSENARDPELVDTLTEFKQAWDAFRPTDAERLLSLQVAYITLNPHPAGSKDILDVAPGTELYHAVHLKYHPKYRAILYDKNYYDIFMLDNEGNCIYSVYKELDYATNFLPNGPGEWKDSGLGEAFVAAMANPDSVNIIDWKPYGPSYGALASFLSMGVRDISGMIIGVYCTQMPPESIPRDSGKLLSDAVDTVDETWWNFRFGKSSSDTPTPPTNTFAEKMFNVAGTWGLANPILQGSKTSATLANLVTLTGSVNLGSDIVSSFADVVEAAAAAFPYRQLSLVGRQKALVQRMCIQSIWIVHNVVSNTSDLSTSMAAFESMQAEIKKLGLGDATSRRLASADELNNYVSNIDEAYGALRPYLLEVAVNRTFGMDETKKPSVRMFNFIKMTETAVDALQSSFEFLGTTTQTTTLEPVRILAPMAFTGTWAGGATMRVATLLAERLINEQQLILPTMHIQHKFFDDHCEGRDTAKIVLEEMNVDDTFVALGGVGCSQACAESSFVAETLKLPFIGYECTSPALSNQLSYPGLTRFGTITISDPTFDALQEIGENYSWSHIIIISGGTSEDRAEASQVEDYLQARRFSTEYILGLENQWDQLVGIFETMKSNTRGLQRNVFLIGSETFKRKLLCAAQKAQNEDGITWITHGVQRDNWWNMSDMAYGFQISWLIQEAHSARLKEVFEDFSEGWDAFGSDDVQRRDALQDSYITDAKLDLYSIPGNEPYHVAHTKWHPDYHRLLFDRKYYDIFVFDMRGNLIYSVYKESDYATNFAAGGGGAWEESGLGEAFRQAAAAPDDIHYIDWSPYGPSAYADAAFFSTGIRNATGHQVGVYTIQLPPGYEQSIDKLHPEDCPIEILAASFEGAINIAGLGKPLEEDMEKPLPCFKGHSAKSFYFELEGYLRDGFPGVPYSAVPDPYSLLKGNAADATCLVAFTLKYFLSQGRSIQEIQNPTERMYSDIQEYIKNIPAFQGATGMVTVDGNDKPNNLVVQQVQQGTYVEVGIVSTSGNRTWMNGGVSAAAWKLEHKDPPPPKSEEFNVFVEVILPFFFVIIPVLLLLALSPLLCLVVIWIFKTCAGRVGSEGGGGSNA
jgi:hypothetical protein